MHPIAPQTSHTIPIPPAIPNLRLKGADIHCRASRANERRPLGQESSVPDGEGAKRHEARQHAGYGGPALGPDVGRAAERRMVSFQVRGAPRPATLYDLLCGPAQDPNVGVGRAAAQRVQHLVSNARNSSTTLSGLLQITACEFHRK